VARKSEGPQGFLAAVEAVEQTLPACEHRVSTMTYNLGNVSKVQELVEKIKKQSPKVDGLVADTGMT